MNPNTQKSLETHTDETLAMLKSAPESDAPLAEVIDFPQRFAAEPAPKHGDEVIEHYREAVEERSPSDSDDRLRFTNRAKRIGKGLLAGTMLTGVLAAGIGHVASNDEPNKDVPTRTDVAEPGDTLWDMAGQTKNVEDRRDVIDWMQDNNPTLSDGLGAGESVKVPLDAEDIK